MNTNPVKRLFFWLSGAGTETLELCPNWEQRKYVAFGATVLVPCAFAFIASSYALSTLTSDPRVIFPVALVWAFIIMTIDRALLAGYRPYLSWTRKFSQFALRLSVAVLMGLTIAHPLVLLLFRDTVSSVVEKDRAAEIETVRGVFEKEKAKVRDETGKLEATIAAQRAKWNETFQAKFILQEKEDASAAIPGLTKEQQAELKKATDAATAPFRDRLANAEKQFDELTPQYTKVQSEAQYWQAEFEHELNGQRSGMRGEGPRARTIRSDQLEPRREESKRLGGLLEHLSVEKSTLQTQVREAEKGAIATFQTHLAQIEAANKVEADRVAGLKRKVEEDQAGQFVTQQNALRDTLKQEIDSKLKELSLAQDGLAKVSAEEDTRLAAIRNEKRGDILTQTKALHTLFEQGEQGGKFAFYTYLVLTALFMMVDTIPLIVKFFSKPGPYDSLVDRDEVTFDSEHKAFLQSHRRYMGQLAEGNLLAVTRNKRLEHALVDGVEHSRAAREFLDSLVEMERAFSAKLALQQEEAAHSSPETLAALDSIKRRFYEDIQHRMESFFAGQRAMS